MQGSGAGMPDCPFVSEKCSVQGGLKMKFAPAVIVCLLLSAMPGCAGNIDKMTVRFDEMDMRVQTLSRTNNALRGRIDELENRILLLQDEVETQRLAGMRGGSQPYVTPSYSAPAAPSSSLPVMKLEPGDAAPEPVDFVAGSDTSEPYPTDYAFEDYDRAVQAAEPSVEPIDGGSLDIADSYQGIDDMGRVVPSKSKGSSKVAKSTARTEKKAPPPPPARKEKPADVAKKAAAMALEQYKAAYSLYGEGRLDDAREAFNQFVIDNPRHAYADNARYWVGECWYDRREYEKARVEFMRVVTEYPDGNKVPDAMVKVGLSDQNLGRMSDARRMYDAVILTYPDSEAAAVATRLIGKMQ